MVDHNLTWKPIKLQYCFVKTCDNSATKTPEKKFFKVPYQNRQAWSRAAGRSDVPKSSVDICEDHIDLENDIANPIAWKYGNVQAKLKSEVPKKLLSLKLFENDSQSYGAEMASKSAVFKEDKGIQAMPEINNVGSQTNVAMASKSVHVRFKTQTDILLPIIEESTSGEVTLPSTQGSTVELTEESTDSTAKGKIIKTNFLSIVESKTFKYLGIPKDFNWLINQISRDTGVPNRHIIAVLFKIKQGDPFYKIADLLDISETTLWRIFPSTLDMLSKVFSKFVYWPSREHIKNNLPLSFRCNQKYANVQSIIDCFEIEIEKPSNPVHQASTWSQYKNCNTVKFLISSTPDGFIEFVSKGYGGRISDMKLVEESGFLNIVPPNCTVLADRGFKHLETVLQKKGVKLLRPPSVYNDKKMTKSESIETKIIASLRIHIERVIRRVRNFKLLKPHSTINNKIVNYVDNAMAVACGLINLQTPVIKIT